jgi:hypothetical protein
MGLESPDGVQEGKRNPTPSLLERFGIEPDNRQTDGVSVNDSVSPIEETQRTQHKASYASESIRSQAQGLHVHPKAGFTNKAADLVCWFFIFVILDYNLHPSTAKSAGYHGTQKDFLGLEQPQCGISE